MDLILWRHAEAADGRPDTARSLTSHGREQARAMAAWLRPLLPESLLLLVSPAKRAQQTAVALDRPFETSTAIATGACARDLLRAAEWPDSARSVLLVGHQPALGEVAALLLTGQDAPWRIAKGAVWWLHRRHRGGRPEVVLRLALEPRLLGVGGD
jgi:phosphohistidine phosphatase